MRFNKLALVIISIVALSGAWIVVVYLYIKGITTKDFLIQAISMGCFGLTMFASSYLYLAIRKNNL